MAREKFQAWCLGCAHLLGVAGGSVLAQSPPVEGPPKTITESETGQHFPATRVFPGRSELHLEPLGVGHRKLFGVSYYSIALYTEAVTLRKGLGEQATVSEVLRVLETGAVPLCFDIQYTRGVSARRRGGVIRERLAKTWEGAESFEKDPEAMKLLAFFSREARRGDESFLWFHPDGRILLEEVGKGIVAVRSPSIRRFILDTYLGPNSVSQDLKESLLSRLDGVLLPTPQP